MRMVYTACRPLIILNGLQEVSCSLGHDIHKNGIKPDYEVRLTVADIKAGKDPQLDKAIELLK